MYRIVLDSPPRLTVRNKASTVSFKADCKRELPDVKKKSAFELNAPRGSAGRSYVWGETLKKEVYRYGRSRKID